MGIKIKFSPLFVIFSFVLIVFGYFSLYFSYITILLIHEFTHYFVAQSRGYLSQSIEMMPFGLKLNDENLYNKKDEIIIALSGPMINIVLATFGVALWWYFPNLYYYMYNFVFSNFVLGVYNLVPIYPLDGGRVALTLCGEKRRNLMLKIMHFVAIVFAILFLILFVLTFKSGKNLSFLMMSFFLISTLFEKNNATPKSFVSFQNRTNLEVKTIMVNKRVAIPQLVKLMKGNYYYIFYVVDDNYKVIKKITQNDIIDYMTNT